MNCNRPESGFTAFPNSVMDNLHLFSPSETQVLLWIVRQNVGYDDNSNTRFSISYIQANTGLSRPTVIKSTKGLIKLGALNEHSPDPDNVSNFSYNWDWAPKEDASKKVLPPKRVVKKIPKLVKKIDHQLVKKIDHQLVKKIDPIKETSAKQTIIKESVASPTTDHKKLMTLCHELNIRARGEPPLLNGGDGKAIKELLGKYNPEIVASKIEVLARKIETGNEFWSSQAVVPRTLNRFWNELGIKPQISIAKKDYTFKPIPESERLAKIEAHSRNYLKAMGAL